MRGCAAKGVVLLCEKQQGLRQDLPFDFARGRQDGLWDGDGRVGVAQRVPGLASELVGRDIDPLYQTLAVFVVDAQSLDSCLETIRVDQFLHQQRSHE